MTLLAQVSLGGSIVPHISTCIFLLSWRSSRLFSSLYSAFQTFSSLPSSMFWSSIFKNDTSGLLAFIGALRTMMNSWSHFAPSLRVIHLVSSFEFGFSMNQHLCTDSEFTIKLFFQVFSYFFFKYFSYSITSFWLGLDFSIFWSCSSMSSFRYLKSESPLSTISDES